MLYFIEVVNRRERFLDDSLICNLISLLLRNHFYNFPVCHTRMVLITNLLTKVLKKINYFNTFRIIVCHIKSCHFIQERFHQNAFNFEAFLDLLKIPPNLF